MSNVNKNMSVFSVFLDCKTSLRGMVSKYIKQKYEVEDILQETFTRTYAADKKSAIEYPQLYLFKTAKNLVQRENTKLATKLTEYLNDGVDSLPAQNTTPVDDITLARDRELVNRALASLPEQCRRVTALRIHKDMKVKDIAHHLELSLSTTEKHLAKGFKACDEFIRKHREVEITSEKVSSQGEKNMRHAK